MSIIIRDMTKDDEYYVGTCTHVYENNNEREESCPRRISWLRSMEKHGLRVKVALLDGVHAGFIYLMPIEVNPWQIQGRDLMVFPCLVSHSKFSKKGIGKELIKAAEGETKSQERKGIATIGYFWDFWFMPADYFVNLGFKVGDRRGNEAILWKQFNKNAEAQKNWLNSMSYRLRHPVSGFGNQPDPLYIGVESIDGKRRAGNAYFRSSVKSF